MQKHILYPIDFQDEFWYIGRNMKHVLKNLPLVGAPIFSASRHAKFHLFFNNYMVKFWYDVGTFGSTKAKSHKNFQANS